MINSVETIGLRIDSSIPSNYSTDIDVNSIIEVKFNSELDTRSIVGNFYVLKDYSREFIQGSNTVDISKYEVVKGSLTYRDRVIIFTPIGQLDKSSRYIVYVPKESIKDFKGRVCLENFVISFDTQGFQSKPPCNVIYPINNSVISKLSSIELDDINSENYIVQISKNKDFENAIYDDVVTSNIIDFNSEIGDGSYFIRARSTNGQFGDVSFFTIRSIPDTLVSDEDEYFEYEPIEDNYIEFIESYPKGVNVSEKTNLVYMKFEGIIPFDDIDFEECSFYGTLSDEEDEGNVTEHEDVDGSYSVVYDEENNNTYVLFIPESM